MVLGTAIASSSDVDIFLGKLEPTFWVLELKLVFHIIVMSLNSTAVNYI
jgi:hypothetical protein